MTSASWVTALLVALVLYVAGALLDLGLLVTLAVIAAVVGVVLLVVDLANGRSRGRL